MSGEHAFRRIDDQITYYGTLDDVVHRYPWGSERFGRPLDLHAIRAQLVTAAIYDKTVVINDGYLIANPLLIPDIEDVSTSLIGTMIKGQAAYLYARGGEANLIEGMERTAKGGAGVTTHAAIMADTDRWPRLKNGLELLERHSRNEVIPWPHDKNMGHVFFLLMESVREKTGLQSATTVPDRLRSDFDAIFKKFKDRLDEDFDQARTVWEEEAWTHFRGSDLDETTLGASRFSVGELREQPEYEDVRAMMNVANEMYHLAQSAGSSRGIELTPAHALQKPGRLIGVATALPDDHEGLLAPRDTGGDSEVYSMLNQLMLSIPSELMFTGDFSFIEQLRSVSGVQDARDLYLDTLWRFANGVATFDDAVSARDGYATRLAEILQGHVVDPWTLRAVEHLGELIIATATAPLTPFAGWLLGVGKDSLKNRLFERVSKRRIEVALNKEGIRASQERAPMTRDIGLYIGPLEKNGLAAMLARVGPHSKARAPT